MALKRKLKNLDGLDEATAKLYKKVGEEYVLDVDGAEDDDVTGLKNKNEELLAENAELKRKQAEEAQKAADAEAARKKAEREAAQKNGDVESLTRGFEEQLAEKDRIIAERDDQIAGIQTGIENEKLETAATTLAATLADGENVPILARFVRDRLRYDDGKVKVTDESGALTVSTTEQLADEFRSAPRYASLITGSKGSGSGATGGDNTGGAGAGKDVDLASASLADRTAAIGAKVEANRGAA